jgi:hypothetical protein
VTGTAPNRQFVIEWRDAHRIRDGSKTKFSFEMILGEDQSIAFNYLNLPADRLAAAEATVGIESPGGRSGLQFQVEEPLVTNGQAITFRPPMDPRPLGSSTVTGLVTNPDGSPATYMDVFLEPMGVVSRTDADGRYEFRGLENGGYEIAASREKFCGDVGAADLHVDTDVTADLHLTPQVDAGGYRCSRPYGDHPFHSGTVVRTLTGDNAYQSMPLPFAFPFYGQRYSTTWVDTNGVLYFSDPGASKPNRTSVPDPDGPNNLIAPFWSDLVVDSTSKIRTTLIGQAPNRQFVVEWRDVYVQGWWNQRFSFEVLLGEQGTISFTYNGTDWEGNRGKEGLIGIENADGSAGYQYSLNEPAVDTGEMVIFYPPGEQNWTLSGTVRKADGTPAAGAVVETRWGDQTTTADAAGRYSLTGLETADHEIYAYAERRCGERAMAKVHLEGNGSADFVTAPMKDKHGYACTIAPNTPFVPAETVLPVATDDYTTLQLPFEFTFYGAKHTSLLLDPKGTIYFARPPEVHFNGCTSIPYENDVNNLVAPFGVPLVWDENSSVRTSTIGAAPNRQVVIEWRNVHLWTGPAFSFEALLSEDGSITFNYDGITAALADSEWGEGVVGIESPDGTYGLSVADHEQTMRDNEAVLIRRVTS